MKRRQDPPGLRRRKRLEAKKTVSPYAMGNRRTEPRKSTKTEPPARKGLGPGPADPRKKFRSKAWRRTRRLMRKRWVFSRLVVKVST